MSMFIYLVQACIIHYLDFSNSIVKALLEYEKNLAQKHDRFSIIDDGDGDLNTPLHLACSHGHYYVTKYFLDLYADPNSRLEVVYWTVLHPGPTLLHCMLWLVYK